MKAFASHFSFEFFTGLRNRSLLMMNYLMPLGFFLMCSTLMVDLNPFLLDQLLPAMVIFAALTATMMGLPTPLIEAREGEVLRSFRINGVPTSSILSIPSMTTGVHIIAASIIITILGALIFDGPTPTNWLAYSGISLAFIFACTGLGSLIGVVSGSSRSAVLWQQLVYLPSMMLGGLMIPTDMLPGIFVRISHLLPTSYGMQAFLGLAYGQETLYSPVLAVLVLIVSGALAFGLSAYLFAWDAKNSTRKGHPAMAALVLLPYLLGAIFLV